MACAEPVPDAPVVDDAVCVEAPVPDDVHPRLLVGPDDAADLRARCATPPLDVVCDQLRAVADQAPSVPDPAVWDSDANGRNGMIAQANALLAWMEDDPARAEIARGLLVALQDDFSNPDRWDVNIAMPRILGGMSVAHDLLAATPYYPEADRREVARRLLDVTDAFFAKHVEDDATRQALLGVAQNNHPVRTAAAIGMVALAFPDDPRSATWLDWAASEIAWLYGPEGRYLLPGGGVSEGSYYFNFGYTAAVPFLVAMRRAHPADRCLRWDCRNRQELPPWGPITCEEGAPYAWPDVFASPLLRDAVAWSMDLRMPDGWRAPVSDGHRRMFNGAAILSSVWPEEGWLRWDWEHPPTGALAVMDWGYDLRPWFLALVDLDSAPAPPPWRGRAWPGKGHRTVRSGWGSDAVWAMLSAEAGPARMTLHDHVDGTSFQVSAFGESLLIDTGYYKPTDFTVPYTAQAVSHNVVLIDGVGAPNKGPLQDFGDADAFLENVHDAPGFVQGAEARQAYEGHELVRTLLLLRDDVVIVADRLTGDGAAHTYQWRAHPHVGEDGGAWLPAPNGGRVVRDGAVADLTLVSTAGPVDVVAVAGTGALVAPHVEASAPDAVPRLHTVLDGVVTGDAPGFLAAIATAPAGGAPTPVAVIPTASGAALRVGDDLVLLEVAGDVDVDGRRVSTDAALAVVGLADGRVYLARGTHATLDGERREVDAGVGVGSGGG